MHENLLLSGLQSVFAVRILSDEPIECFVFARLRSVHLELAVELRQRIRVFWDPRIAREVRLPIMQRVLDENRFVENVFCRSGFRIGTRAEIAQRIANAENAHLEPSEIAIGGSEIRYRIREGGRGKRHREQQCEKDPLHSTSLLEGCTSAPTAVY